MQNSLMGYVPHISIVAVLAVGTALVKLARWSYQRMRRGEQIGVFVESMATNHLPHIYDTLLTITDHLGIVPKLPPPISTIAKEDS